MTSLRVAGVDAAEYLDATGALDPALPTERIDTHAATILLNGDRAWKIKRPVRFRYLDFTGVDQRRAALEAELRLNRRTAPNLYRAVHAIRRDIDGRLRLDGPGQTLDWVLEMTRFDADALLDHQADRRFGERGAGDAGFDDALMTGLADQVADLHRAAEVADEPSGARRIQRVVDGNLGSMSAFSAVLDPARARLVTERLTRMIAAHQELLDERGRAGRVRRGHGDLHLGNIAIIDAGPVLFDCLEFDEELATTDVLYDLAFLLMDLWARGLRHEANVVANRYLDTSPQDENAVGLLPLMIAIRATVRAHVCAAEDLDRRARNYLELALRITEPAEVRLIAVGGGSGTGKSTLARRIGGSVGAPPGARILRTDVLRKRLAGVAAEEPLPRSSYTPQARGRVYAELGRLAAAAVSDGVSVIADAVFGEHSQRDIVADVARQAGCEFNGVWLELPEAERIARIESRGPDASDADADVVRRQSRTLDVPSDWTVVDASGGIPANHVAELPPE